jgi:prevent-host-death family protein
MKSVSASNAKAHLLGLLDEVEQGETIVITRHGRPIARLVRDADHQQEEGRRAIESIKKAQKAAPRVSVEEILAWRDEGRK